MAALTSALGTGVTLPSIPANFWLSFTSGTGSLKNLHEIDDLQVWRDQDGGFDGSYRPFSL